tara:strand:- start:588 stop:770 length:183 start_codon:yes stop_codon:yes gene_type:complete
MVTEKLEQIINVLCESKEDAQKCEGGNASAGTRVRKTALEATKLLKDLRSLILEIRKKDK